MYIIKNSLCT